MAALDSVTQPSPRSSNNQARESSSISTKPVSQSTSAQDQRPTGSQAGSSRRNSCDPLQQYGYQMLGPIAAGAFSQIVRARHSASRREVAIKTFNKSKCVKEPSLGTSMKNELKVLKLLQSDLHEGITNLVDVLETKTAIHAVLEYCGGGSLHRQLGSRGFGTGLSSAEAVNAARQLCSALAHVHAKGIAHRDVKPENILFVDSSLTQLKLCDFGFAVCCGEKKLNNTCGSPQYMAPELNRREPYLGQPVDVWALCTVVFEMLHGKPAFRGSSMEQLGLRIMRVSHEAFGSEASSTARSFIKSGLVFDAQKRATASELEAHPWLRSLAPKPTASPLPHLSESGLKPKLASTALPHISLSETAESEGVEPETVDSDVFEDETVDDGSVEPR